MPSQLSLEVGTLVRSKILSQFCFHQWLRQNSLMLITLRATLKQCEVAKYHKIINTTPWEWPKTIFDIDIQIILSFNLWLSVRLWFAVHSQHRYHWQTNKSWFTVKVFPTLYFIGSCFIIQLISFYALCYAFLNIWLYLYVIEYVNKTLQECETVLTLQY